VETDDIDEAIRILNKHQHLGNNTWQHDPEGSPKIVCLGTVESEDMGTIPNGTAITHQEAITAAREYAMKEGDKK
jgi:hypothetical protein